MCNRWVRFGRTDDAWNGCEMSANVNSKDMGGSNATCTNSEKVDRCNKKWLQWRQISDVLMAWWVVLSKLTRREINHEIYMRRNLCWCVAMNWCWEKLDGCNCTCFWWNNVSRFPIERWTGVSWRRHAEVRINVCIRDKLCGCNATCRCSYLLLDTISVCVYWWL